MFASEDDLLLTITEKGYVRERMQEITDLPNAELKVLRILKLTTRVEVVVSLTPGDANQILATTFR